MINKIRHKYGHFTYQGKVVFQPFEMSQYESFSDTIKSVFKLQYRLRNSVHIFYIYIDAYTYA